MLCEGCSKEMVIVKMFWETVEGIKNALLGEKCAQQIHSYCQMADKLEICTPIEEDKNASNP